MILYFFFDVLVNKLEILMKILLAMALMLTVSTAYSTNTDGAFADEEARRQANKAAASNKAVDPNKKFYSRNGKHVYLNFRVLPGKVKRFYWRNKIPIRNISFIIAGGVLTYVIVCDMSERLHCAHEGEKIN